jgi:hypothetical protein
MPNRRVMKRIAAPMVGEMLTSTVLALVVIPAIHSLWKGRALARGCSELTGRASAERASRQLCLVTTTVVIRRAGPLVTLSREDP